MKPSRSINSLASQQQPPTNGSSRRPPEAGSTMDSGNNASPTSPICRCRVTYLGSSVPHITKDGLQGIQEPLRELYPDKASLASGNAGIDSWLSVWSNGILIENVDETGREVKRFFKIDALHYCAAVKYVPHPQINPQSNPYTTLPSNASNLANLPKFLPLDSPHARQQTNSNPPIFASILRRTTGIKVLECHAFICKREAAANALVRCCFHAYADTMYAKQIGADVDKISTDINNNNRNTVQRQHSGEYMSTPPMASRRSKSIAALNDANDSSDNMSNRHHHQEQHQIDASQHKHSQTLRRKSMNEHYAIYGNETSVNHQQVQPNSSMNNLQKQKKLSKSMHHLNQNNPYAIEQDQTWRHQAPNVFPNQPFYNPYASRVPSYPPQNLMDAANGGGTLKSVKSVAATSIASTLLRSKKHAKAMSMAQLNHDKIISFHQAQSTGSTLGGPMMMPPVPPMFLPNMPNRPMINGSQTMKAPSRSMIPMAGQTMNFEAMTPKEMKKMLKKSAKYGIDPSTFGENGLPIAPHRMPHLPPNCHLPLQSKSGTMGSSSLFSVDIHGNDVTDLASIQGFPTPRGPPMPFDHMDQQPVMRPMLVKPNPDFLKSKAGKKWLKQQREFKKLLPPHLDGLPIIFGPPPVEALEPAQAPANNVQSPAFIPPPHPGLPMMDSSGYYNPHPFYGPSGRASAASTLMRYSPQTQAMYDNGLSGQLEYMHPGQMMYANNLGPSHMARGPGEYASDNSSIVYGNNELGVGATDCHYANNGHRMRHHMVEQSVISLEDENDYDDDEGDDEGGNRPDNGYYDAPSQLGQSRSQTGQESNSSRSRNADLANNNHHEKGSYSQDYEQIQQSDDQSSYSSGIYRKGHMNERAFSYSIRQEHRSSGGNNSDGEYATGPEAMQDSRRQQADSRADENHRQHSSSIFQNNRNQSSQFYQGHDDSQTIPVNQLTARLESQLSMKSFANSRVKSHM